MKLAIVTASYHPHPGGVAEHVAGSAAALAERGHEVTVLAPGPPLAEDGPEVVRVGRRVPIPWKGASAGVTLGSGLLRRLRALLMPGRFDVVHVHEPLTPLLPAAAVWLAFGNGVPVAATFHAGAESDLPYRLLRRPLGRVMARIEGRIAVSEVARDLIERYFPGEYAIIPNGVDVSRFRPTPRPGTATILFVGRLDPRKGVDVLVRAMPGVRARVPEARLLLVGDGPERRRLEQLAARLAPGAVVFAAGDTPNEALPAWYARADVACFPSTHNESFGIVLLEAMASGRPVVASDTPGYRVLIQDGTNGRHFESRNPADLARVLVDLLSDPARANPLTEAGLRTAQAHRWDRIAPQLEHQYEMLSRGPDPLLNKSS